MALIQILDRHGNFWMFTRHQKKSAVCVQCYIKTCLYVVSGCVRLLHTIVSEILTSIKYFPRG